MNVSLAKELWNKVKAWGEKAILPSIAGILLFLSLRYWKKRALSEEAIREIERSRAEVAGFERLKEQVKSKVADNGKTMIAIDKKIEAAKANAVKQVQSVEGMSPADVAKEFERLGY